MDDSPENGHPVDASDDGAAQTVVRPKRRPAKQKKRKGIPRYHVILWDDDHHSYEYVILMLQDLFGHPIETGFKLAQAVDTLGRVTVLTTTKEHAELKVEQITAYGADEEIADSVGSMTATIEADES